MGGVFGAKIWPSRDQVVVDGSLVPTAWASRDETAADDSYFINAHGVLYKLVNANGVKRYIRADMADELGVEGRYYFPGDALMSAHADFGLDETGSATVTVDSGRIKMDSSADALDHAAEFTNHGLGHGAVSHYIRFDWEYAATVSGIYGVTFRFDTGTSGRMIEFECGVTPYDVALNLGAIEADSYGINGTERMIEMCIRRGVAESIVSIYVDGRATPIVSAAMADWPAVSNDGIIWGDIKGSGARGVSWFSEILIAWSTP